VKEMPPVAYPMMPRMMRSIPIMVAGFTSEPFDDEGSETRCQMPGSSITDVFKRQVPDLHANWLRE
jgi:hypothetical protein